MRKIIWGLCFFAFLLSLPGNHSLAYQERAREATLISYEGEVLLKREGKEGLEKPAKNLPLFNGDSLITREKSRAQISLADGGSVTLLPDSQFYINLELENEAAGTSLVLLRGSLTAAVSPKSPNGSLQVETYTLAAMTKGAAFTVSATLDGSTHLGVETGEIIVTTAEGPLTLKEHQEVNLAPAPEPGREEGFSLMTLQAYKQRHEEDREVWQKKIEEQIFQNPVAFSQKMLQRLEAALKQERDFLKQIDQETNRLSLLLEEAHKAKKNRDFETLKTKQAGIKISLTQLKDSVLRLRRLNNRLTVIFELGKESGQKLLAEKKQLGDNFTAVRTNYRLIKNSSAKVRLMQQEARRITKERLPRLYLQSKALQEEK